MPCAALEEQVQPQCLPVWPSPATQGVFVSFKVLAPELVGLALVACASGWLCAWAQGQAPGSTKLQSSIVLKETVSEGASDSENLGHVLLSGNLSSACME